MMARDGQLCLETKWSRKSTYPIDVVLLLPMQLRGVLEVRDNRTTEVELLLLDLFLLVLGAAEVLEDTS